MKTNEEYIDFGSITIPTSWDEMDLKTYQEIEQYYADKDNKFDVRDVLHIITKLSEDDVNSLPLEFTEKILEKLEWITTPITAEKASPSVKINGEIYQVNVQEKLKTGEFIAVDSIIKADTHNYAAILAIICRKKGEIFDSHFENEVLPSRIEMWEKVSIAKVKKVIDFFFECYVVSQRSSQMSSMVKELIESTLSDIETSRRNGDLSAASTVRLKRKLRKLEKSINSI